MSIDIHVFLNRVAVPAADTWQDAICQADLPVEFGATFDPLNDSGFAPCTLEASGTGFEYSLSEREDIASVYPDLGQQVLRYDSVISFSWSSNLRECAAAMIAAGVLTSLSSGLLYDPQENLRVGAAEGVSYARTRFAEVKSVMARFPKA